MSDTDKITVMVVDDHPMWREGVARDLTEAGFDVVATASTGTEALTRATAVRPRVVVLDLQLEQSSGFDVLRAVHSLEPRIAFYMLSNFSSEPYRRQAERLGARGFFDKSTDFDRLRDLVAQRAVS